MKMKRSCMNAGTASLEEKKKRQTVKMKKLRRSVIPWVFSLGFKNIVAIINPITVRTINLERNSSGVREMFLKFLRIRIQVSEKNEFEIFFPMLLCMGTDFEPIFEVR